MTSGDVLLITGGSRGIGAATARLAATEGYKVAVNYCNRRDSAVEVVSEIRNKGGFAVAIQGDVAREADVERMFAELDENVGPIVALVNCAGVSGNQCAVVDFDEEVLDRLFRVNVIGTILCCRNAVRRMTSREGGQGCSIVNVSSMAATIGGRAGSSDYAASKAAVDTFTVGLAKEVGSAGIRVNVVRPGMTLTEMTASVQRDRKLLREITSTIPLNRIADAEEIARPIVWLLSDEASFISGACIDVSGGGFVVGKQLGD